MYFYEKDNDLLVSQRSEITAIDNESQTIKMIKNQIFLSCYFCLVQN